MSIGDGASWSEHDQLILDALERDLSSIPRYPGAPGSSAFPDGSMVASWRALALCFLLFLIDAAMLAVAVRLGSSLFTFGAIGLFPFVMAPLIRSNRANRTRPGRRSAC